MKEKILDFIEKNRFWTRIAGILLFACLMSFVMNVTWSEIPSDLEVGKIARQDYHADKDYEIVDYEETGKLKRQALEDVIPVFDWDEDLEDLLDEKIVESRSALEPWQKTGILIRNMRDTDKPKILIKDLDSILSVDEARKLKRFKLRGNPEPRANLFFNEEDYHESQEKALDSVMPIIIKVQAGEAIIRNGDRFEARHLKILNGIREEKALFFGKSRMLGAFFFVSLFVGVFLFVFEKTSSKARLKDKDLIFLGTLLVLFIVLERSFIFIGNSTRNFLPFSMALPDFYPAIPIAAAAMMVRLMLPVPVALFFAPILAAFAGLVQQSDLSMMLYYLSGGMMGVCWVKGVKTRSQILKVGLWLGGLNILSLAAIDFFYMNSSFSMMSPLEIGMKILFAFLGGALASILVLILSPVFENLFNYLTPIKLIEYGSLNHPLLRDMIVQAPGTYHHSHMVGTLAESACAAIGADSLFARVACYFHDIGKMKKSGYFIENMPIGEDRHAILSPSMSALIIVSHVKDGIELAKEHKLPQKIIDIIPQHQGTKLISYFFNKAKERENKDLHVADEREFRYPGPKPQTREAGVILLADTIEAATRALKDRSPARLEEVVRNMINKNFIDGQLDECELTLKDLHVIGKSFVRILMGIYHKRIEYPPDAQELMARGQSKGSPREDIDNGGTNADKYHQQTPIRSDALQDPKSSPTHLRPVGGGKS